MASRLDEILKEREKKIDSLKKMGVELYPARSTKEAANLEIVGNFEKYEGKVMTLAGRIMTLRGQGALLFFNFTDGTGSFQGLVKKGEIDENLFEWA